MIARTEKSCAHRFDRYGGRGIKMCYRWRRSFEAFLADMGLRPSARHSIDRVQNDLGYWCGKPECPECGPTVRAPNCRWATKREQSRNTCHNRRIQFRGRTMILADWSAETGIAAPTIRYRLKSGWTVEDALTKAVSPAKSDAARMAR